MHSAASSAGAAMDTAGDMLRHKRESTWPKDEEAAQARVLENASQDSFPDSCPQAGQVMALGQQTALSGQVIYFIPLQGAFNGVSRSRQHPVYPGLSAAKLQNHCSSNG
jgi:hypothetical protein